MVDYTLLASIYYVGCFRGGGGQVKYYQISLGLRGFDKYHLIFFEQKTVENCAKVTIFLEQKYRTRGEGG